MLYPSKTLTVKAEPWTKIRYHMDVSPEVCQEAFSCFLQLMCCQLPFNEFSWWVKRHLKTQQPTASHATILTIWGPKPPNSMKISLLLSELIPFPATWAFNFPNTDFQAQVICLILYGVSSGLSVIAASKLSSSCCQFTYKWIKSVVTGKVVNVLIHTSLKMQ